MIFLRTTLVLGMVFHKLVWEFKKREDRAVSREYLQEQNKFSLKSVIKFVKSLALIFLVFQTLFLDLFPISIEPQMLRIFGVIIYFAGLFIAVSGRLQLGNNWANLEDYQVLPQQKLVNTGLYAYIRHPIYTGDFLLILGLELALNSRCGLTSTIIRH